MPTDHIHLQRLHGDLLGWLLRRGIPFADAQDLAGSAVESAFKHYNPAKGPFRALCFAALKNLTKNYWRDRKVNVTPDDNEFPGPEDDLSALDDAEKARQTLESIMAQLDDEEKRFLLAMGEELDEFENRVVSKTARRLGLDPQEGWNIFRRIQRKAKGQPAKKQRLIVERIQCTEVVHPPSSRRTGDETAFAMTRIEDITCVRELLRVVVMRNAFEHLLAKLSNETAIKVEKLLS